MGLRKEYFIALGGFNENFRGNAWGFEADFGLRAARERKLGRYVGDAVVIHHEASGGGSRDGSKKQWLRDFMYNHKVLIGTLGPQAWLGSLPRLMKKWLF
jgi:GT2 family glycosyltransferase